ncbi:MULTISPECIES: dienelactone hydrolase family protein [unclassified Streptomyces]|uniref:dienelactone hydrolase family protein n=1 Tax=unclassified Streptomyces TaxID=2593676 RepID=UPI000DBA2F19|nr:MULTISPECIES: dienelactone hydrolase family protein [unclassified Streptomyces]MYT74565.1 dienelactone hydrolase family protein [Streptomyces sp. SID8367]RAJ91548.1 carboxymethylenebutenolidase [Streptomyces sp. PsTaAH-137]
MSPKNPFTGTPFTKTLSIPTPDGTADAFAASPGHGARHPAVLLYMDAFGLRAELESKARELASHGYYVLVPNVFYRDSPTPVVELPAHIDEASRPALFETLWPMIQEHTAERALRDADAFLAFLAEQAEVDDGPVAAVGYCMGAALALRTGAARPDRVAAVAGFHPAALVTDAPDSPHHRFSAITGEIHLGLAEGDMTPESLKALDQALTTAGHTATTEIYPGTVHGFTMSDTSAFDAEGSRRHWDRLLPLLERALGRG